MHTYRTHMRTYMQTCIHISIVHRLLDLHDLLTLNYPVHGHFHKLLNDALRGHLHHFLRHHNLFNLANLGLGWWRKRRRSCRPLYASVRLLELDRLLLITFLWLFFHTCLLGLELLHGGRDQIRGGGRHHVLIRGNPGALTTVSRCVCVGCRRA